MTTSRAREAFHTVRKEEILDAAMGVLVRRGPEVTLQEIAEAAGNHQRCSVPLLHKP